MLRRTSIAGSSVLPPLASSGLSQSDLKCHIAVRFQKEKVVRDRIFISYRRNDSRQSANEIRLSLVQQFGRAAIFYDSSSIGPGERFPQAIGKELARSVAVLVIIGNNWLTSSDADGNRRLDLEDDWVRTEISTALLDPEVAVIPILVDGATMPILSMLDPPLPDLATLNAVTIDGRFWDQTMAPLIAHLEKLLPMARDSHHGEVDNAEDSPSGRAVPWREYPGSSYLDLVEGSKASAVTRGVDERLLNTINVLGVTEDEARRIVVIIDYEPRAAGPRLDAAADYVTSLTGQHAVFVSPVPGVEGMEYRFDRDAG